MYTVVSGSHLYGTNTNNSDYDIRGFKIPTLEELCNLFNNNIQVEQTISVDNQDLIIHSFPHFYKSLIKGNTQSLELLFVPEDKIIHNHPVGEILRKHRHMFITRKCFYHLRGFLMSEYRKAYCVEMKIRGENENNLPYYIQSICSSLGLKRFEKEQVVKYLEELSGQPIIEFEPTTDKIGEQRLQDFNKYGYCRKHAYHCIRLLYQGIELFDTGRMVFPLQELQIFNLMQIRSGNWDWHTINNLYTILFQQLEQRINSSPNTDINKQKCTDLYMEIIRQHVL